MTVANKSACMHEFHFVSCKSKFAVLNRCYVQAQVAENGSVMFARFSYTYKCAKIESYLLVNCVKFLLNPLLMTKIPISIISLCYRLGQKFCCVEILLCCYSFIEFNGGLSGRGCLFTKSSDNRPFSYSENESGSNDISLHSIEFSNVHNCDRSSNATQSNLAHKIV